MHLALMVTISIHVLAGVFWAGSTFVVARNGGAGAERLFVPQMVAASIVIVSGGYLWKTLHEGPLGPMEQCLGLGVASAMLALGAQLVFIAPALRTQRQTSDDPRARTRLVVASRAAALLLAFATIAMAAVRYA